MSKVFGSGDAAFRALDAVNLAIEENAFFTLLGPSGCGKTTLLRFIAGFEHPSAGVIRLGGRDMSALGPNRRPVNTVFQNYALFPHMSVAQNVGLGLRMLGRSRAQTAETVARMLDLVRMTPMAERYPAQISGGQQQCVALARALAPAPRVLLLDELSALDLKLRKEMQGELKRLQAETGITFLFVTHDQEEALTMSDRIAVMSESRVLQVGAPREIYERPAMRFVAEFIGETNFLQGALAAVGPDGAEVRLDGSAVVEALLPEGPAPDVGGRVTLVVRPEHARLDPEGVLVGRIEGITYFETDTLVHLRLAGGEAFTLRRQNAAGGAALPGTGAEVHVALAPGAVQVLRG